MGFVCIMRAWLSFEGRGPVAWWIRERRIARSLCRLRW